MRVLVTGASGFVGSHVVRTLLERHYTVFGLTRGQRTIPEGATALIGDVEDVASLLNAIRTSNCHIVINCAGVYAWWLPDPSQFEVNATGVQNLLEALAETPAVALVQVSTVLAYGRCCAPKETFNESTPVGPHSSQYAASKHRGDRRQRAAVAMQPLSTRGARAAGASLLTGIDCNAVLLEPLGPHRVCAEQLVPEIRDGSVQARAQHEGQRLVRRVCVQRQRNVAEAGAHENQNAEASMNSYDRPARRHVKWTLIYEIEEGQYL